MPHNIDRSAFHKGEYVGYGQGTVWRIRRSGKKGWTADPRDNHGTVVLNRQVSHPRLHHQSASSLKEIAQKIWG